MSGWVAPKTAAEVWQCDPSWWYENRCCCGDGAHLLRGRRGGVEESGSSRNRTFSPSFSFFSSYKTFVSPLSLSRLMTTSQKHWRRWRPEKTRQTISVTVSATPNKKIRVTHFASLPLRYSFSPLLPILVPPRTRPLCWSRRVVTDASSQPWRREEKSENAWKDRDGGSWNQTFYANAAVWDAASKLGPNEQLAD